MTKKLTLEELELTAQRRGGHCLATKYKNSSSKVKWKCSEGHVFDATTRDVRSGRWCPRCSKSFFFKEEICRLSFETIFKHPFPKCRPDWLLNERGNRMELDGYNKNLKLAFEYNGEQHYKENFFSQNMSLQRRIKNDELKINLCKKNGILLITFTPEDDLSKISEKIKKSSHNKKAILQIADFNREIDFDGVWQYRNKIASLRQFVSIKNGKLISKKYQGQKTHLIWQCKIGHEWHASYAHIRAGYWCIKCARDPYIKDVENPNSTVTIEHLKFIARSKGGDCLSDTYLGDNQKLIWKCAIGHVWDAVPTSIKQGRWCPDCGGRPRLNLQIAQQAALDFQGECLSEEYINVKTKMKWRCKEGHEWQTSFDSVRQGNWCRRCAQTARRIREKN